MRSAGHERKPPATGSSSDAPRSSRRTDEGCGNHDRKDRCGIALDRHLLRILLDLAPRDPFPQPRAAQTPVPFRRGRDVDGMIESTAKLVPPDRVVLRDASPDHQSTRFLRTEYQIGEFGLIAELVDRETLVILPEGPQLVPHGSVEDRRHVHRDSVLPGPPKQ